MTAADLNVASPDKVAAQFKPTNLNLIAEANSVEKFANDSLRSWVILGQTEKYQIAIEYVRKLRHAVTIKGLNARRDYLGWN